MEHFYSLLVQKVIAATSSKREEEIGNAKKFFSRLAPKISVSIDWEEVKHNPDEVFDFTKKIVKVQGTKIVIYGDAFQNIKDLGNPEYFQKSYITPATITERRLLSLR